MGNKYISPVPKHFPCQVGVDFWMRTYPRSPEGKMRYPAQIFYKYTDAVFDKDGWADPEVWLPIPFDMCYLQTERKVRTGWWTGKEWDGLRLKPDEKILRWKRCQEEMSE